MSHEASRVYPVFRFGNANAMITWLGKSFGFVEHEVFRDDQGVVVHAELAFGSAMIMIGQARDDAFAKAIGHPSGPCGKAIYLAVEDADALFSRASAAGATILEGLTERDYGSREFTCQDPEGNIWSIGTYWPKTDT
ncbi:glyoxalase [Stappia sp. BW2]|uniref:VOC family protein n=1 Tax=Stappia sp. BW2 TaxID=2592622 RepID=UPI0011DEF8A4|nr:glyoxalase [Stappia sp. BW2]